MTSARYSQFGKKGLLFIVPQPLSRHSEIVIPRSQVAWMIDQPDHVLSTYDAHNAALLQIQLPRPPSSSRSVSQSSHAQTSGSTSSCRDTNIDDEVQHVVGTMFGEDTENWKSHAVGYVDGIVPRVINRLLVGPELCRNKQFVDNMTKCSNDVVRNMLILQVLPKVLHPVIRRLLGMFNYMHWRSADAVIQPLIRERLNAMLKHANGDAGFEDYVPPEDFVTWTIRQALAERRRLSLIPSSCPSDCYPLNLP